MSKSSSSSRAYKRGASVRASAFWVAKMIPSLTECRHGNESKKAFSPEQISCRADHGRQQTQTLRTPADFPLEQDRLRDKTIRGRIWPLLLSGKRRPAPLRESFGEELRAACMTAIISGPRYGSTVGTSLFRQLSRAGDTTRFRLRIQYTSPVTLFPGGEEKTANIRSTLQ